MPGCLTSPSTSTEPATVLTVPRPCGARPHARSSSSSLPDGAQPRLEAEAAEVLVARRAGTDLAQVGVGGAGVEPRLHPAQRPGGGPHHVGDGALEAQRLAAREARIEAQHGAAS